MKRTVPRTPSKGFGWETAYDAYRLIFLELPKTGTLFFYQQELPPHGLLSYSFEYHFTPRQTTPSGVAKDFRVCLTISHNELLSRSSTAIAEQFVLGFRRKLREEGIVL